MAELRFDPRDASASLTMGSGSGSGAGGGGGGAVGRCARDFGCKAARAELGCGAGWAGGDVGGGDVAAGCAGSPTFFGGSWNQLFLQFAQRTWRPLAPTALSGTT